MRDMHFEEVLLEKTVEKTGRERVLAIDTLHELLDLAIGDFERVIADPRYTINMNDWHVPKRNKRCAICLAGSVLAATVALPLDHIVSEDSDSNDGIEDELWHRMHALNGLRLGNIEAAYRELNDGLYYGAVPTAVRALQSKWHAPMCRYLHTVRWTKPLKAGFIADLKEMHGDLVAAGL